MDKIVEILKELVPDEEFEGRTGLVEDEVLQSIVILNLISELEDEFDIDISVGDVVPENFDSVEAIWALVQKYQG